MPKISDDILDHLAKVAEELEQDGILEASSAIDKSLFILGGGQPFVLKQPVADLIRSRIAELSRLDGSDISPLLKSEAMATLKACVKKLSGLWKQVEEETNQDKLIRLVAMLQVCTLILEGLEDQSRTSTLGYEKK